MRDADVGSLFSNQLTHWLKMGRATLHVDVDAIEIVVDHMHGRAQSLERCSSGERRSSVACIERDRKLGKIKRLILQ